MYRLALKHCRNRKHIQHRGVCARTDTYLIYLHTLKLCHRLYVVGTVGTGSKRNERGEVDGVFRIVNCVLIGSKLHKVCFSFFSTKECTCNLVRGEERAGCAKLCAHICYSSSLGNGKCLNALSAIFYNRAHTALNTQTAKDLKNNVLCANVRRKSTCEIYLDDLGHSYVVCAAAHSYRNVKTACAHTQHTDTACSRRMAVRADKGLSGNAEAFEMNLMADSVTGAREADSVLLCYCLNISVVVGIFKACLKCVVVDISNRQLGLYSFRAHSFKLKISHCARCVLCKCLVDAECYLASRFHFTRNKVIFDYFLCYCVSHFLNSVIYCTNGAFHCVFNVLICKSLGLFSI